MKIEIKLKKINIYKYKVMLASFNAKEFYTELSSML